MSKGATAHWAMVKLADICNIISGKNQSKVVNPTGKYPIYGSGGIIGYADDYLCEPGATIIGRKGTINSPIYVRTKFWNVDTAFGFSPDDSLESRLLYFFCEYFNFKKLDKSTAVPSLAKRDLLNIDFPLPPLPEQRAIVAKIEQLFSELDNGIANFKTAQAQLKVYRQAVLKKAFEGELTKEWREKNNIKPNWENTTTGEIMPSINSGSTPKAEFLSSTGDVQFLKVYNLNFDGTLNHGKDPAFTTLEIHTTKNKRAKCIAGDVLINIVGPPLGKVSMIPFTTKKEFNINQAIVRFRPNEKITPKFLSFFLQNPMTINWLKGTSKATAGQYNVKVSTCRLIPIALPKLEEQHQIVQEIESRLSVCDKIEESITESLTKAEALRQSILKKAFEGKLLTEAELAACRNEPDWEPAEKLLERKVVN